MFCSTTGMSRLCQTVWRGVLSSTEEEFWNGGKLRGRKGPDRQWTTSWCREARVKTELSNHLRRRFLLILLVHPSIDKKWSFWWLLIYIFIYMVFCHCLQWFTAFWRNITSFLHIILSGNTQEKASDVRNTKFPAYNPDFSLLLVSFPGSSWSDSMVWLR